MRVLEWELSEAGRGAAIGFPWMLPVLMSRPHCCAATYRARHWGGQITAEGPVLCRRGQLEIASSADLSCTPPFTR